MRHLILIAALAILSACATWEGLKSDVQTGADKVDEALN